jgi:molybdate transport repressor ModE-like protein
MSEVNLTLIQTFYLVARHGSYSAAARELNLSYQSAANHVRRLEQILKDQLVHSGQGAKRVTLTPRGRTLYNLLHPELDTMLERLSQIVGSQRAMLRIGMPQAIFFYLFPAVIAAFREKYPAVEIVAYERDTVLAEMVKNGGLDVCIGERFFGDATVPQRLVGSYGLSLVYPRGWGAPPTPAAVPDWASGRPFVTFEPGQTLRNLALDFLRAGGHAVVPAISTSGSSSVKRCVEAGLGFAIIPSWCVAPADRGLVSVPIDMIPRVEIFFGQAQFLTRNVYVMELFDICRRMLVPQAAASRPRYAAEPVPSA